MLAFASTAGRHGAKRHTTETRRASQIRCAPDHRPLGEWLSFLRVCGQSPPGPRGSQDFDSRHHTNIVLCHWSWR